MGWRITEAKTLMIALRLKEPFRFVYGTFYELPRVLVRLEAQTATEAVTGWGEAAIDFPFVPYDIFDVYDALCRTCASIVGLRLSDRRKILFPRHSSYLDFAPASRCALNMALDDACARANKLSATELYGARRTSGTPLYSVAFGDAARADAWLKADGIIKLKVGQGLDADFSTIRQAEDLARLTNRRYALDFNAAYKPPEAAALVKRLREAQLWPPSACVTWEQPLSTNASLKEWAQYATHFTSEATPPWLVADESFTSVDTGVALGALGIGLNFKIQKFGGLLSALRVEATILRKSGTAKTMIGGTFPSSLGRAYDNVAARVMRTATMPGDGLLPASSYLAPDVVEIFCHGVDIHGLGVVPDQLRLADITIEDPREEFMKVRTGREPSRIKMEIGAGYAEKYKHLSGREIKWNLQARL